MRVLVTGGRDYADMNIMMAVLDDYPISVMCHGGARGADTLADRYARLKQIPVAAYPADWNAPCRITCKPGHRRGRNGRMYCPAAGNYRNQLMLEAFTPDLVVAFPGGAGTADMVARARRAAVAVLEVP